jgi:23S rRNA (uridine2552-2'-O)-methyltransferase
MWRRPSGRFRSRAAYKLIEIDSRFHFLKSPKNRRSWHGAGRLVAGMRAKTGRKGKAKSSASISSTSSLCRREEFRVMVSWTEVPGLLKEWLATRWTWSFPTWRQIRPGMKTDHLRIIGLAELAADFACGSWPMAAPSSPKGFQGGTGTSCSPG